MEGMELQSLNNTFNLNKGDLEEAVSSSRSASIPSLLGSMQFSSFGTGTGGFFHCPIDVPFCHRAACVPTGHDYLNTETNAHACYSQPGCCFDETLLQYRIAFGPGFFQR